MTLAMVKVLPEAGDADQRLLSGAGEHAFGQPGDGLRLVSGRLIRGGQFEHEGKVRRGWRGVKPADSLGVR